MESTNYTFEWYFVGRSKRKHPRTAVTLNIPRNIRNCPIGCWYCNLPWKRRPSWLFVIQLHHTIYNIGNTCMWPSNTTPCYSNHSHTSQTRDKKIQCKHCLAYITFIYMLKIHRTDRQICDLCECCTILKGIHIKRAAAGSLLISDHCQSYRPAYSHSVWYSAN